MNITEIREYDAGIVIGKIISENGDVIYRSCREIFGEYK